MNSTASAAAANQSSPMRNGSAPSPTYSESSLCSSNSPSLCTPDHFNVTLPNRDAKRQADLKAANARFMNATSDSGRQQAQQPVDLSPDGLAAALDFAKQQKQLLQQQSAAQDSPLSKKSGHKRNLSAARRYSIQTLMPANDDASASPAMIIRRIQQGLTDIGAPISPTQVAADSELQTADALQLWDSSFDFEAALDSVPMADFLLSPPRLTVSLAQQQLQQTQEVKPNNVPAHKTPVSMAAAAAAMMAPSQSANPTNDEIKRRKMSLTVTDTPQRPLSAQTVMQSTPPNSWTQMQARTQSIQSSVASSRISQTPQSFTTSLTASSIFGSGGSSGSEGKDQLLRQRRRSSISCDATSEIASLTAGLSVPSIIAPLPVFGQKAQEDPISKSESTTPQPHHIPMAVTPSAQSNASFVTAAESKLERSSSAASKGADVWPDDVEVAFWEALRLIPKLGRRKVLVHGKPCGRNELIADYIERKTGKQRTRKQVSSHIQVLKNIKKGDAEFQQLIAEPQTEEDFYIPAGGMMYAQTLASYGYGGLGGPLFAPDGNANLFSPYSNSMHNSPLPGAHHSLHDGLSTPLTAAFNGMHLPSPGIAPTPLHDPKAGMSQSCPILPSSFSMWVHCSSSEERHIYTSLERKAVSQNSASLPRLALDSVRLGQYRFPRLAEMYHHLPCQFLHIYVPLSVPKADVLLPRYDHFSTQLSLTSVQDTRLTTVTTVYSHGKRVLSLVEPLDAPRRISGRSVTNGLEDVTNGTASPRATANSLSVDGAGAQQKHKFWHQAPFATDFWADFLSRNHPVNVYNAGDSSQSFGKEPSERAALGMAVSGVTIVQEFVVASDQSTSQHAAEAGTTLMNDTGNHISPGSKIGSVVLVIAWDLECVESLAGGAGTPVVSLLTASSPSPRPTMLAVSPHAPQMNLSTTPNRSPAMGQMHLQAHNMQPSPMLLNANLPQWQQHGYAPSPTFQLTTPQPEASSQQYHAPSLLQKRGVTEGKPNLNIAIPAAPVLGAHGMQNGSLMLSPYGAMPHSSSHAASPGSAITHNAAAWGLMQQRTMAASSTPVTPHPQMVGTPNEPPPMGNSADEIAKGNRDRLARAWAAAAAAAQNGMNASTFAGNAMGLQLHSPLDVSFGAQATQGPSAPHNALNGSAQQHRLAPPMFSFDPSSSSSNGSVAGSACTSPMPAQGSTPSSALGISGVQSGQLLSPAHFDSALSPALSPANSVSMNDTKETPSYFNGAADFTANFGSLDGPALTGGVPSGNEQISTQEWMDQLLQSVGLQNGTSN